MAGKLMIYNTLTRRKEELKPLSGNEISIYSCGPTVYNYAHIGNLRTYIFMDTLRRVLKYNGYKLKHVMNITDVGHLVSDADDGEDKMVKAAKEQQKSPWEIAEYYTKIFFGDLARLNIDLPEIIEKVTNHINDMIDFVVKLLEVGVAYETSDGIYYDISKFPNYGKLSRMNFEEQIAGASERVDENIEKRHPSDFALWIKAPKEHIMQWPSPWGMGYPGWHIECSTLAKLYLGDEFDIHTGGVDHIPIHHENEIAQSEALTGKKVTQYWMHAEFLLVNNGKMSKSLGNTYTIDNLGEKGFSPLCYRYFCLNGNYRNKLNFTWDSLAAAKASLQHFYEALKKHKDAGDVEITQTIEADSKMAGYNDENVGKNILDVFKSEFDNAVNDDLNIPLALGVVWNALRHPVKSKKIYDFVVATDVILGLDMEKEVAKIGDAATEEQTFSDEIMELVAQRTQAKKDKQYALADEIRAKLLEMGIVLTDTKDGVKIAYKQ